jgi:hypothetical protein
LEIGPRGKGSHEPDQWEPVHGAHEKGHGPPWGRHEPKDRNPNGFRPKVAHARLHGRPRLGFRGGSFPSPSRTRLASPNPNYSLYKPPFSAGINTPSDLINLSLSKNSIPKIRRNIFLQLFNYLLVGILNRDLNLVCSCGYR